MLRPHISQSALAGLAIFAIVSLLVSTGVTQDIDVRFLELVGTWRTPAGTTAMQAASAIGNWEWELPLALGITAVLLLRGRGVSAWRFVAVCVSAEALYAIVKLLFHRPRPTVITHLGQAGWYSYPSGHSMLAPVIWGLGLVLLAQSVKSRSIKAALWLLAIIATCAIAVSRVYLGVHYLSDVLGGLALGMTWVVLWRDWVTAPWSLT